MKHFLLLLSLVFGSSFAQVTYELTLVGEGNFGTPNGDVFVRNTTVSPATNSVDLYQTSNGTTGFDVLQDFKIAGNKAIFIEKPFGNGRIVIADKTTYAEVHTFDVSNAPQTIGVASATKAYVSYGNPADIVMVDLATNTLTSVTDPTNAIYSYSDHMVAANGFMFAQMGSSIVKIDTLTNSVVDVLEPAVGTISGLVADDAGESLWVMGGGTLKSIDLLNGDQVSSAIYVGTTSSKHVRFYDNKIYFWSATNLYIYDIALAATPVSSVYTTTLPGSSYSIGYGRSFDIDETTGDFVIASANTFSAPGYFEVVDGATFTVIESASMPGCAIPNNCMLKTYHSVASNPVPDQPMLATVYGECDVTLTAPTATGVSGQVIGTTSQMHFDEQGSYTVEWVYSDAGGTSFQYQFVVVDDTQSPVVDLQDITVGCDETVNAPMAIDNCAGEIEGTTNNPTAFDTAGEYYINWSFDDENGNAITLAQLVTVECGSASLSNETINVNVYPNPAVSALKVAWERLPNMVTIADAQGKIVSTLEPQTLEITLDVSTWSNGVYFLSVDGARQRIIVQH